MIRFVLLSAVLVISAIGCKRAPKEDPAQGSVVRAFYKVVMARKEGGIPGAKDLNRMKPFISSRLYKLLVDGGDAEDLFAKKTNNEVPPMIEGSLFFSLFEGADRILSFTPEHSPDKISYLVEFEYGKKTKDSDSARWKDRVILIREGSKWVVDDIELLGDWDFATKGRLSEILMHVVKEANETEAVSSSPNQSPKPDPTATSQPTSHAK